MSEVVKKVTIQAPLEKVWEALTDLRAIVAWMDDETAQIDLTVGGKYTVFGGDTTGKFTRIEAPRHLEYTWRMSEWCKSWNDTVVTWSLRKQGAGTRVTLVHSQFPNEEERTGHESGWDDYWLTPMKAWLER